MRFEAAVWVVSPRVGIGAGGRTTFDGAAAGALVDLTTRLVIGS